MGYCKCDLANRRRSNNYLKYWRYPPHVDGARAQVLPQADVEGHGGDAEEEREEEELHEEDGAEVDGEDGEAVHAEHAQGAAE